MSIAVAAGTPLLDARFLLLEALGHGGLGRVYRAFDRAEQRLVAVKVSSSGPAPLAGHPFAAEFESWSRLRHPHIVRAFELRRSGRGPLPEGTPYLVLEHVSGPPVHRRFPPGRLSAAAVETVARQVLSALDHVHRAGLVHRDLKPGNVLAASGRGGVRLKLTDFGLAAEAGAPRVPGRLSGSLPYVAPEAILGAPLDGRADLYGLGILLHLLASGRLPMSSSDPAEVLRWHLTGERPDLSRTSPALPERIVRFISRLAARDVAERPASAAEALAMLGATERTRTTPRCDRFDRAQARLAVDAARRGEGRVLEVRSLRSGVGREARVQAQILGVEVLRVASARDGETRSTLGRVVLRLLVERGPEVAHVVRRHGLLRGIPLEILGGLPVWDRMRAMGPCARLDPEVLQATAAGVAEFILETCRARPRVVVFERGASSDPLAARTLRLLRARAPAGLLLIVPKK